MDHFREEFRRQYLDIIALKVEDLQTGEDAKLGWNLLEVALAQIKVDSWYFLLAYFVGETGLDQLYVERIRVGDNNLQLLQFSDVEWQFDNIVMGYIQFLQMVAVTDIVDGGQLAVLEFEGFQSRHFFEFGWNLPYFEVGEYQFLQKLEL